MRLQSPIDDRSRDPGKTQLSSRARLMYAFHAHLARMNATPRESIDVLTTAAKSYGPDHYDRRQAAFCGIVLMRRFDIYFDNKERIGDPTDLSVPLERGLRTNYPFLDFIASHWTQIKTAFRDGFLQRFTRFSNESNAWNSLLSVAHQNADMAADAEQALEQYQELQTSAPGLRFLAKRKPRSPQLRNIALKAVNGSGASWMDFLPIDAACEILLDQFKDEKLAADLEDLVRRNRFTNGPILALCLGWPDSALVQGLLSHLNEVNQLVAAYVFFSAATIDRIVERLPWQLHQAAYGSYWGRYIRRPLLLRLGRDADLCAALYGDMMQNPSPWKKCAYLLMAELACYLGLRICEVLGLMWDDFDEKAKTLSIRRSAVDGVVADVKSEASRDVIPLNDDFISLLTRWQKIAPTSEEGWMFPSIVTGRPYHAGILLRHHLQPLTAKVGVRRLGWHTFRHTFRSWLDAVGTAVGVQQKMMRHADVTTTMNVYGKGMMDTKLEAHTKLHEYARVGFSGLRWNRL
jgi:integrase/acyl carrier protein phosphodiesterase